VVGIGWQARWFQLTQDALFYYPARNQCDGPPTGVILLEDVLRVTLDDANPLQFEIAMVKKVQKLQWTEEAGASAAEWVQAIDQFRSLKERFLPRPLPKRSLLHIPSTDGLSKETLLKLIEAVNGERESLIEDWVAYITRLQQSGLTPTHAVTTPTHESNARCEVCRLAFFSASNSTRCPNCRHPKGNTPCALCGVEFYSASGNSLCPSCRHNQEDQANTSCQKCSVKFYSPSGNSLCPSCRTNVVCSSCGLAFFSASGNLMCPNCRRRQPSKSSGRCRKCEVSFYSSSNNPLCPNCRAPETNAECCRCSVRFYSASGNRVCPPCRIIPEDASPVSKMITLPESFAEANSGKGQDKQ